MNGHGTQAIPNVAAAIAAGVGVLVLLGWTFDLPALKSILPQWVAMKVPAALCFCLAGASLWLLGAQRLPSARRMAGRVCATLVLVIAGWTLLEFGLGTDLGINRLFSGRMALATALAFLLLSSALLLLDRKADDWTLAAAPALLAGGIGVLGVSGYFYGAQAMYSVLLFSQVSAHAAACLTLLAVGILCARPDAQPMKILLSEGPGRVLTRQWFPLFFVVPLVLGWLSLLGQRAGYYGPEFGNSLVALSSISIFSILTWSTANLLNQADANIREGKRSYRELIESLPQLVWTCRPDGPCDYLSPQWVAYTGIPGASQLGSGWLDQIHPEDRSRTSDAWQQSARAGIALDVEFRIRRHDGVYRWFATRAEPLRDRSGAIVKWFGTNTDINAQKEASERLAQALREILDLKQALDEHCVVAATDAAGKINYVNDKFCQITEYSREQLIGADHRMLNSGYHTRAFVNQLRSTIRDGKIWKGELCSRSKSGNLYWEDLTIVPFLGPDGSPRQYVTVRTDITFRKEAENFLLHANEVTEAKVKARTAELEESYRTLREAQGRLADREERLEEAQAVARIGSWEWRHGVGLTFSRQLLLLLERDAATYPAAPAAQAKVFTKESWEAFKASIRAAIREGKPTEIPVELVLPNGSIREAISRCSATGEGERLRVTGTLQDVTERRSIERALQRAKERAELAHLAAEIGIWDYDLVTGRIQTDAQHDVLYGVEPGTFGSTAEDWQSRVHPDDLEAVIDRIKLVLKTDTGYNLVFRGLRPDGTFRHFRAQAIARRNSAGRAIRLVGALWDVTEQVRARQTIEAALAEKEVLLREIHHRVKNNMQLVSSLLELHAARQSDPAESSIFRECQARIAAMARVHERLYRAQDLATIDFGEHLRELVRLQEKSQRPPDCLVELLIQSQSLEIPIDLAIPLGLIAAELVSNAWRHAYIGRSSGRLSVRLERVSSEMAQLIVSDDGPGLPDSFDPTKNSSLGWRLIRTLCRQIRAGYSVTGAEGTVVTVPFPLPPNPGIR